MGTRQASRIRSVDGRDASAVPENSFDFAKFRRVELALAKRTQPC